MAGHVRDLWMRRDPTTGRKVRNERYGKGMRWQAVITRADGSRATKAFANQEQAKLWAARMASEPHVVAPRVDFAAAADAWLESQHQLRDSSKRSARDKIDRMLKPALQSIALSDLTRPRLQELANDLAGRYSPSTVRVAWSHLRGILKDAHLDGLIPSMPTFGVRLPAKPKTRVRPLTDEQVLAMRDAMPGPLRMMIVLGAVSGLRPGELAGLTWDRVEGSSLRVDRQLVMESVADPVTWGPPKSASGVRVVGVGEDVIRQLEQHREAYGTGPEGLVFASPRGGAMDKRRRGEFWARYRHVIDGKPGESWHQLRHYHASKLIAAGMSVVAVAARLGHRDVTETLSTYAHLWPGDESQMEAVAVALGTILSAPQSTAEGVETNSG